MFSSARKHIKRVGLTSNKVLYNVEIKTVTIPGILSKNSVMSICFERGGKIASSKNYQTLQSNENTTISINETLSLMATLYREKNGSFQIKKGKIVLRELIQNKLGGSSYQGLGLCNINLHDFVPNEPNSVMTKDITLTPEGLGRGIIINITISSKFFITNDDDGASIMSGVSEYSEQSTLAANFDNHNINSLLYVSNDASRRKLQISPIKQSMTINEGDEEKLDKVETKTITVSRSEDKEDIVNNTKRIIEEDSKGLVEKYPTLSKKFLGLDNITDETNELIDDLKNQIQILQKEVNSKDLAIKAIEIEGENKLEEFKATILSLRTELYVAQQALQQEKSIRLSLNKEINSKSDSTLATALAMAREETAAVAQEYAQACAECRALEDEVKLLKRTVEMAVKAKNEETQSAIAAATLATAASIRRAELEAETDGLLEELIETKMRCANLAEEKDNIEKKNWLLRRRLQWVTNYYLIILLLSLLLLLLLVCRIDRINGNSSKHAEINNDN